MRRHRNGTPNGFTLLELLTVVIIIGILAAIGIPNLLNARARSQVNFAFKQANVLKDAVLQCLAEGQGLVLVEADLQTDGCLGSLVSPADSMFTYTLTGASSNFNVEVVGNGTGMFGAGDTLDLQWDVIVGETIDTGLPGVSAFNEFLDI